MNMYKTAVQLSSNHSNLEHSTKLVDEILFNNGYSQRIINQIKDTANKKKKKKKQIPRDQRQKPVATLTIPHITDRCTSAIKQAANDCFLSIRVVSRPGQKLGQILTSSRPLDKPQCPRRNCDTCTSLENGRDSCVMTGVVYQITCNIQNCGDQYYIGETGRTLHERFV